MPMMVGLLILAALVYQMFFRYEIWPDQGKDGVVYEHDNLTGDTYPLRPEARTNVIARILGHHDEERVQGGSYLRPLEGFRRTSAVVPDEAFVQKPAQDESRLIQKGQVVPVPKEVVIASTAPPVPMAMLATSLEESHANTKPFAVRQVDLNQDGTEEEIIQNALGSDGLLDISIVKNGQEIFYGRGQQIVLLPSRSIEGWSDIALKAAQGTRVYRYSGRSGQYQSIQDKR